MSPREGDNPTFRRRPSVSPTPARQGSKNSPQRLRELRHCAAVRVFRRLHSLAPPPSRQPHAHFVRFARFDACETEVERVQRACIVTLHRVDKKGGPLLSATVPGRLQTRRAASVRGRGLASENPGQCRLLTLRGPASERGGRHQKRARAMQKSSGEPCVSPRTCTEQPERPTRSLCTSPGCCGSTNQGHNASSEKPRRVNSLC